MKRPCVSIYYLVLLMFWPLLISCASSQPEILLPKDFDVDWAAEKNSIVLKFAASDDLNLDRGQPASLAVCVYQLSETRAFEALRDEGRAGLAALAACRKFGDSVLAATRYFIEPGQRLEPQFLDRREGARFVGVAAGYYNLTSPRCARLFPVPIVTVKDGWFARRREAGQLLIELNFGSDWPEAPADSTGRR